MKKFFIYFSIIFTTILAILIWILSFSLLLNLFPASVYEWLKTNLSLVNDWCNHIKNDFTNVQMIGFYLLLGCGLLLMVLFGSQYPLIKIEAIRRHILWISIPLYSIGFSGTIIGLILIFINLL